MRGLAIFASCMCLLFACPLMAADASDLGPVGSSYKIQCTGSNPSDLTWTVVKNDGQNYRTEANDGSYVEGPLWGRASGFSTVFGGSNGKFVNELESEDLKGAGAIEVGAKTVGYVRQTTPQNRTFQHRYDIAVVEAAERETPFGKFQAYKIVTQYGNSFWMATRTNWYAPELKLVIESVFETNQASKTTCLLMGRPQ